MKILTPVLLVLLIAILFAPAKVSADGMFVAPRFVWDRHKDINEPTQKAILVYDTGREDLILQVKYEGPVDEFGWLIPVPNLPTVQNGSMKCFYELSRYTQRLFERHAFERATLSQSVAPVAKMAQVEPPVKVVEVKTVGAYKVAVLSTKDSDALGKWLDTNQFYFPANKSDVLDSYVKRHWYFIAVKINLDKSSDKSLSTSSELASGELNPLQISFDSDHCVFPLKISSVNEKPSEVQVYVLSPERLLEKTMLEKKMQEIYANDLTWTVFGELAPYAEVTKTDLPDCYEFIPRLADKSWWLTKQTWNFQPEEMRDLEFEPAFSALVEELGSKYGHFASKSLSQIGLDAVPTIIAAMQSTNPTVRANAAWIFNNSNIGYYGLIIFDARLTDAASVWLKDSLPSVRIAGIKVLTDFSHWNPAYAQRLVSILRDENAEVRQSTVLGLSRFSGDMKKYIPSFQAMLKDEDSGIRATGLEMLQHLQVEIPREGLLPPANQIPPLASTTKITSVTFLGSLDNYTLTINGTGFGSLPGSVPFNGVTPYFRLFEVAQLGAGEWGYPGDANPLGYQSWTDTQIQISGLAAKPGDAVQIWASNPTTGSSATWGGNVPGEVGNPQITSVTFSGSGANLQMQIDGSGFGGAPTNMPFTGNLNQFLFADQRTHSGAGAFEAGGERWGHGQPNPVTVKFQSWSDSQIIIGGFNGSYGQDDVNTIQNGDPVYIVVWNSSDTNQTGPQTAWGGFVSANPTASIEAPSDLSPDLQEILRLSRQGIPDDVIINFIKNSGKSYNLSSDDVAYLKGRGISAAVISALPQTTLQYVNGVPTLPDGTGGQIRILSGTGSFASVSDANNTLNVSPGDTINGIISLSVLNLGPGGAVAPLIYTPSWGDNSSSWKLVNGWVHPGQLQQQAQVSLVAPTTPGVYHIIFAMDWEVGGDHVASGTSWAIGKDLSNGWVNNYDVWNDGNDIADFNADQLSSAQINGWAMNGTLNGPDSTHSTRWYFPRPLPADAITLVVTGSGSHQPTQSSALSPDLQEVLKLSKSGMNDDVITNYIKNTGKIYKLSADDIIYLNNQGVSKSVIMALLHAAVAPAIETPPPFAPSSTGINPPPAGTPSSASSPPLQGNLPVAGSVPNVSNNVVTANNAFAFDLYSRLANQPGESVFLALFH